MPLKLFGGARGALALAALAAAGTLVPMKFGAMFLDPAILLAYTAVAVLFTSNYVTLHAVEQKEFAAVRRAAVEGVIAGWVSWLAILGTALGALISMRGRWLSPPPLMIAALMLFVAAVAGLTAGLAALVSVSGFSAKMARDLMRMCFFLLVVVALITISAMPDIWRMRLSRIMVSESLPLWLLLVSPPLALAGWGALLHARTVQADKQTKLSITGE